MVRSAGHPKVDGELKLAGLTAPVKVLRDELGIPYIFAANTPDLMRAQGFVTAQNRLMQMELFRATWRGELAATFGADALPSDIRMRVLGMRRNGDRHALKLDAASRAFFQNYVDGVNAYVKDNAADHPIELKVAGLMPAALERGRSGHAGPLHPLHAFDQLQGRGRGAEADRQAGLASARSEILPLTVNPDWATPSTAAPRRRSAPHAHRLGAARLSGAIWRWPRRR